MWATHTRVDDGAPSCPCIALFEVAYVPCSCRNRKRVARGVAFNSVHTDHLQNGSACMARPGHATGLLPDRKRWRG